MGASEKLVTKIFGYLFILHFIQWVVIILLPKNEGVWISPPVIFITGVPSLLTAILLLGKPKIGIPIAIFRSIMGIYFATQYHQFLNIDLVLKAGSKFAYDNGLMWFWPSLFFLITIIVLSWITIRQLLRK